VTAPLELDALYDQGRAAHPAIAIDRERFATAVRARAEVSSGAIAADLYLAIGCELGVPAALAHLEIHQLARLVGVLRRIESSPSIIDEIIQRVRVRALVGDEGPPRIATYSGRGSLLGWLKVMALRLLANHRRDEQRRPEVALLADSAESRSPDELLVVGLAPIVSVALREALRALPSRERNLMRMSYSKGIALERIGQLYGVHKATISRWLAAARDQVLADALARVRATTNLPADVLAAACGQLESKLEVGLSVLYSTRPGEWANSAGSPELE
jgi:RNA polymerase sigma-70 factor (ECF subfamily)